MSTQHADVIVIGAGPGGYVAAIKAAQLGFKVVCVESRGTLGGTCLNVGCIPSKALLESSEKYAEALHGFEAHGISASDLKLDLATLLARKDKLVRELTGGIDYLFKKYKVTRVIGHGAFTGPGQVQVTNEKGETEMWSATSIIIATGSQVMELPGVTIDEKTVVSSTGALELKKVPDHLVVIGGGYIGLEMGTVWQRLGSKVTVVEFMDKIVPAMDGEVGKALHKTLEKQGLQFKLSTKVTGVKTTAKGVELQLEPAAGGAKETLACDVVLVAIGRKPNTQNLGLENIGVALNARGQIPVSAHFETVAKGVYAIGDVIPGPMLAHKAEDEGVACAEIIAGQAGHVNYDVIPAVVYTWPEVATVGKTEEELKGANIPYKVGKFPFAANGRAKAMNMTDGFVKILAHEHTDEVLGVHIIGPQAGTIIAQAAVAMEFKASSEDIARTCHAHPTLNESVKEAAMAVTGSPIHF
jgi:dihydrolipoamide dehydrogenase